MTTRTALVCAAVIGIAAVVTAADAARDAFGVGVLRRDGVVIPFATFDGKRWRNWWPEPQRETTVPISVASVPKGWWGRPGPLESWQAWVDGGERPVRVMQPDWVNVHCQRHLALRTDYATKEVIPSEGEQPYPKDGLAVSPPQAIQRIEALAATAVELQAVAPALRKAFNLAERETAGRTRHPVSTRDRERVDVAIEAAYAFGQSPRYYYVEAMRAYRTLGDRPTDCLASAFGTGWFVREGDTVRPLVTYVDVLPCSRFGASYMLPLGVVQAAGRPFWLAQFSGAEHERYVVLELAPKKVDVMVSTWGGGC